MLILLGFVRVRLEKINHPEGWSNNGKDPYQRELEAQLTTRASQNICAWLQTMIAGSETFLIEITPSIDIDLGFFKPINEPPFDCCKGGYVYKCQNSGFEVYFGLHAEVTATWKLSDAELNLGCGQQECPAEGKYFRVLGGISIEGDAADVGGEAEFKAGWLIGPDLTITLAGTCTGNLTLPGGLSIGADVALNDNGLLNLVGSFRGTLQAGGNFDVGSFSYWSISCDKTTQCCSAPKSADVGLHNK